MIRRSKGRPDSQGSLPPIANKRTLLSQAHSDGVLQTTVLPNPHVLGGGTFSTPGTEAWRNQPKPVIDSFQRGATQPDVERGPGGRLHPHPSWNGAENFQTLRSNDESAISPDPPEVKNLRTKTPSGTNALGPVRPPSGNLALHCMLQNSGAHYDHGGAATPAGETSQVVQLRDAWGTTTAAQKPKLHHPVRQKTSSSFEGKREGQRKTPSHSGPGASSPTNSQLVNKPGGASDLIPMHLPELSSNARTGNEAQTKGEGKGTSEEPESGIADVDTNAGDAASDSSNEGEKEKRIIEWLIDVENSKQGPPPRGTAAHERRLTNRGQSLEPRKKPGAGEGAGHDATRVGSAARRQRPPAADAPTPAVTNSIHIVYDGD